LKEHIYLEGAECFLSHQFPRYTSPTAVTHLPLRAGCEWVTADVVVVRHCGRGGKWWRQWRCWKTRANRPAPTQPVLPLKPANHLLPGHKKADWSAEGQGGPPTKSHIAQGANTPDLLLSCWG
jgi:hypothetical protein